MAVTVGGTSITFNDGTTQSTAAGAVTTTAVLNATAAASVGAVGTYALLGETTGTSTEAGSTRAGSALRYAGLSGNSPFSGIISGTTYHVGNGGTPAGTWRAMGRCNWGDTASFGATLWLRIS